MNTQQDTNHFSQELEELEKLYAQVTADVQQVMDEMNEPCYQPLGQPEHLTVTTQSL